MFQLLKNRFCVGSFKVIFRHSQTYERLHFVIISLFVNTKKNKL
jgi:hypothetical protein